MDKITKIEAEIEKAKARKNEIETVLLPRDKDKLEKAKADLGASMAGPGLDKEKLSEIHELETIIEGWEIAINYCQEKVTGLQKDLTEARVEVIQQERPVITAEALKELAEIVKTFDNLMVASDRYSKATNQIEKLEGEYKTLTGDPGTLTDRPLASLYHFGWTISEGLQTIALIRQSIERSVRPLLEGHEVSRSRLE
jgi:hypothetical protein